MYLRKGYVALSLMKHTWSMFGGTLGQHIPLESLGRMRSLWPNVPIMTLSATFAPHVASYVHKSLELIKKLSSSEEQ